MDVKQFGRLLVAAITAVAIAILGGLAASSAVAQTATVSNQYAKLKKQRNKQVKKCKVTVRKAKKGVRKAKKQVRKAKSSRSAKRVRKANKRVRKAKKRLKKAKRKSKKCVKGAKKRYRNKLSKLAPESNRKAPYSAQGSVGDAYVTGAPEGQQLMLVNGKEKVVQRGQADAFGSKVFYDVKPGAGYSVRSRVNKKVVQGTAKFKVLKPDENPSQSFYKEQKLVPGLNFVKMRDGVELAMTVKIPSGAAPPGGWPVLIEHSGYGTAAPHDLLGAVLGGAGDPLAPDTSTAVGALIAPQMRFASIMVQMRGTGCSGGAYDLFGLPTTYDGYDMVEIAGNQSWSSGKVGMVGISYSGISQLFAAGTKPPHLAAITPMSPTTDLYSGTGYPGGIFNQGFALGWLTDRVSDARPAPEGGQRWARELITNGDSQVPQPKRGEQQQKCLDNQNLRLQTRNIFDLIEQNPFRTPSLFESRTPGDWLAKSKVPTFFVGSFQDEQTGGQFAEALPALKDNPDVWMVLQNGVHVDSLSPSLITQWGDFVNLFVADRIPQMPGLLVAMGSALYGELADAPSLPIQESKYAGYPQTAAGVAQAKAAFRADNPRLRLLMDNGNAVHDEDDNLIPGGLGANWEVGLDDYPAPNTEATTYYLGDNGKLSKSKDGTVSEEAYTADPAARPKQTLDGTDEGAAWKAQPPYDWAPVAAGKGLGFTTEALAQDTLIAGPSSLDLQLKSTAVDTDIQVAITEVRPDGNETYVQSGWLRASHRKLDPKQSSELEPVPTHLENDAADLPAGQFSEVRVPIFPVAHMFRAGSKIRVTITPTGGDRPRWDFRTVDDGTAVNTVQLGGATPSKLVLPVIPGVSAPAAGQPGHDLPAPTALRGQPSRSYETASNGG